MRAPGKASWIRDPQRLVGVEMGAVAHEGRDPAHQRSTEHRLRLEVGPRSLQPADPRRRRFRREQRSIERTDARPHHHVGLDSPLGDGAQHPDLGRARDAPHHRGRRLCRPREPLDAGLDSGLTPLVLPGSGIRPFRPAAPVRPVRSTHGHRLRADDLPELLDGAAERVDLAFERGELLGGGPGRFLGSGVRLGGAVGDVGGRLGIRGVAKTP